jgi:hypothetical protein
MRCGKCKGDHETVAEVKACYGVKPLPEKTMDDIVLSREQLFGQDAPVQIGPLASAKQLSYLSDLRVERGMDPLPPNTAMERSIASARIAELLLVQPEVKTPATVGYANIHAGHYAIPGREGRELDFYRVDRPDKGKWAGHIFVKMVVGGKPDLKIRDRNRIAEVLAEISADPDRAAWEYGQAIGQCDICNIHLTDEVSRRFSRGPDCRKKHGLGYMGRAPRNRRSVPDGLPKPSRPRRMAG